MKLRYLITGTGRSGSVYMARLLTSVGIPCGHEAIFDWRGIRWAEKRLNGEEPLELSFVSQWRNESHDFKPIDPWINIEEIEAESSYLAAPFLTSPLLENTSIIHIVRNPIKVINSFCNYMNYFQTTEGQNSYEQFIYRIIPTLKNEMSQYDRACLFYMEWNGMIEKAKVDFFFPVESDPHLLFKFLKIEPQSYFVDKTINSWKKQTNDRFSVSKIVSPEIKSKFVSLLKKYGYRESEYLLM